MKRRAVINPLNKTSRNEFVSSSTVRDVNKLLRNCFEQAVKWELMEKNPCTHATVPKHKSQKRDISEKMQKSNVTSFLRVALKKTRNKSIVLMLFTTW